MRLPEGQSVPCPVCLGGARHRPPEDVGGVGGYESFLANIKDKSDPERDGNLTWARKDTGGRLFDPEHFYLDEINARLLYVLADTPEVAEALFMGRGGLTGVLKQDWSQPAIVVGDEHYTWERLGNLLLLLGEDLPVTIKVGRSGRGRGA